VLDKDASFDQRHNKATEVFGARGDHGRRREFLTCPRPAFYLESVVVVLPVGRKTVGDRNGIDSRKLPYTFKQPLIKSDSGAIVGVLRLAGRYLHRQDLPGRHMNPQFHLLEQYEATKQ
jgi:hypothetical protein